MLSRKQIHYLRSLHQKKIRHEEGKFLIESFRLVGEGLKSKFPIETIWITQEKQKTDIGKKVIKDARNLNISIETTTSKSLDQISDTQHNQGIIATANIPDYSAVAFGNCILALDRISDPGNMGTLLRTAEWFGLTTVLISEDCVDPFNSKVVRGGMGAHFWLNAITTVNLKEKLQQINTQQYTIFGADMTGTQMSKINVSKTQKWVLVVGSEADGISKSITPHITTFISIPGNGNVESLNAAVAGGILMEKLMWQ